MRDVAAPLEAALASRGLSVADVAEHLVRHLEVDPSSTVFAYGSLVEGLGNASSDLDLCILTGGAETDITPSRNSAFEIAGLQCDLMPVSKRAFRRAIELLRELNREPVDVRRAALELDYPQRRMLHALLNGETLMGAEAQSVLGTDLAPRELIRNLLARTRYWFGNLQADLAGMRRAGDWTSMILPSQEAVLLGCDALLAALGKTNPTPKWRVKQLETIAAAGTPLSGGGTASPAERLFDLLRVPATLGHADILGFALRAVAFGRRSLLWAERALLGLGETRDPGDGGAPGASVLDLDIGILPDGERLRFVRPGDGAAVTAPADLSRLIVGLDEGTVTTALEAAAMRAGGTPLASEAALFLGECEQAGFLIARPDLEARLSALLG
ncbi:MAG TPA: hypothetical protein VF662_13455 [Allosphingosinicella sp.]|jgi:predicted nucleotidyltransferase